MGGLVIPRPPSKSKLAEEAAKRMRLSASISRRQYNTYAFCYLSLLPVVAIFVVLRIYPILSTLKLSFYQWDMISSIKPFVGLKNFLNLIHDPLFRAAFLNTTILAFATVILSGVFALALAVALNNRGNISGFYQAIYFLPVVTPMVPVSIIWKWIYDPGYGLLNYLLSYINIKPIPWLLYPKLAIIAIIIVCVWQSIGYNMVIFLVGLKSISRHYYEAAEIDGASKRDLFWYITLPLLKPIILYVLVTSTINGFNIFTPVYIMTTGSQGTSGNELRTLVYNMYEDGFRYFKMGYASAQAVFLLLIVLLLTIAQFGLFRQEDLDL